jgi:hypothetical protein
MKKDSPQQVHEGGVYQLPPVIASPDAIGAWQSQSRLLRRYAPRNDRIKGAPRDDEEVPPLNDKLCNY